MRTSFNVDPTAPRRPGSFYRGCRIGCRCLVQRVRRAAQIAPGQPMCARHQGLEPQTRRVRVRWRSAHPVRMSGVDPYRPVFPACELRPSAPVRLWAPKSETRREDREDPCRVVDADDGQARPWSRGEPGSAPCRDRVSSRGADDPGVYPVKELKRVRDPPTIQATGYRLETLWSGLGRGMPTSSSHQHHEHDQKQHDQKENYLRQEDDVKPVVQAKPMALCTRPWLRPAVRLLVTGDGWRPCSHRADSESDR